jgi:hypothetical protein
MLFDSNITRRRVGVRGETYEFTPAPQAMHGEQPYGQTSRTR